MTEAFVVLMWLTVVSTLVLLILTAIMLLVAWKQEWSRRAWDEGAKAQADADNRPKINSNPYESGK